MPIDPNDYDRVLHVDLTAGDNWMHVVRAERLLGRKLTDAEHADVLKRGSGADCVRDLVSQREDD